MNALTPSPLKVPTRLDTMTDQYSLIYPRHLSPDRRHTATHLGSRTSRDISAGRSAGHRICQLVSL